MSSELSTSRAELLSTAIRAFEGLRGAYPDDPENLGSIEGVLGALRSDLASEAGADNERASEPERNRVRSHVMRALEAIEHEDGEVRYRDVEHMMIAVDWAAVPFATIRTVLAHIVEAAPIAAITNANPVAGTREPLSIAGMGLAEIAQTLVQMTERCQAELAYEAETGRPCPTRGIANPKQGEN